jgi:hypothetical protein
MPHGINFDDVESLLGRHAALVYNLREGVTGLTVKLMFLYCTVSTLKPMVGTVWAVSPSFSLYKMVVFPAASSPRHRILASRLETSSPMTLASLVKRMPMIGRLSLICLLFFGFLLNEGSALLTLILAGNSRIKLVRILCLEVCITDQPCSKLGSG